jgi:hypothetical protein
MYSGIDCTYSIRDGSLMINLKKGVDQIHSNVDAIREMRSIKSIFFHVCKSLMLYSV